MIFALFSGCVDELTGTTYKVGEMFNDGCNDCVCMENGGFACTKKFCIKESKMEESKFSPQEERGLQKCLNRDVSIAVLK